MWLRAAASRAETMASASASARDDADGNGDVPPPDSPQSLRDDDDFDGDEDHHAEDDGEDQNGEPLPDATMGPARWRTETITNDARHFLRRYETVLWKQHGGFPKFISQLRDVLFVVSTRRRVPRQHSRGRGFTKEEIATILDGLFTDGQMAHPSIQRCARVFVLS